MRPLSGIFSSKSSNSDSNPNTSTSRSASKSKSLSAPGSEYSGNAWEKGATGNPWEKATTGTTTTTITATKGRSKYDRYASLQGILKKVEWKVERS
ncbi:hypothetical protein HYALB_00004467 [Hymenoscyphus albidus]|uniref:Uncharacterized protein n=1 Tax=Hymenoscyphus albidus TaxID=595503 RepID=A0A9N9LK23_9HELO|nr:hypothetical protein HYALB_00004467 [Hymenoscyphus albidus]